MSASRIPNASRLLIDTSPTLWDKQGWEVLGWMFLEFPEFTGVWRDYFVTDAALAGLQTHPAKSPESGEVMPGCGGLRKTRWPDPRRGKGKRGGLRVIYLVVPDVRVVVLADVYDKNEADDLTPREKREVARLAAETKAELVKRLRRETPQ